MSHTGSDRLVAQPYLLSGGESRLLLSPLATGAMLAVGLLVLVAGCLARQATEWMTWTPSLAAELFTAWLLAALTSRWLGNRLAITSGLVYLTSLATWASPEPAVNESLLTATLAVAMAAVAMALVPGHWPAWPQRQAGWLFYTAAAATYLFAGAAGPIACGAATVVFLVVSHDSRSARFLINPLGMALFVILVLVGHQMTGAPNAGPIAEVTESARLSWASCSWMALRAIGIGLLPWTPLTIVALIGGLRQGHAATPIWCLMGAWSLAIVGLGASGLLSTQFLVRAAMPPLAVMGAAGLLGLWHRCRYGWR